MRLAGLGATFALGVLLARSLGPAEFGIYGLVTTLSALGMSIALLGTPQLAVRELSIRKETGDWAGIGTLHRHFASATTAASLLIAIGAIVMGVFLTGIESPSLAVILPGAVLIPLMSATALIAAELRGLGALGKGQVMDILVRPALAFIIILAIILSGTKLTAQQALWAQVFVALVAALGSLTWIARAIPGDVPSVNSKMPWLTAAIPLGAVDLLRQLDGSYGVVLLGWLASDEALGIFRVALACNVVVAMPVTILHIILAPRLGPLSKNDQREELQALLSRTSAAMIAAVLPITIAAGVIGRPAIELVFGSAYAAAWVPLFLLCLAQLAFATFGMGPILLAMCEGERQLIRIYVLAEGIGLIAAIPLIIRFGAGGAAGAMILSNGLVGFLSWRWAKKAMGVDSTLLPLLRLTG